MYFEALNNLLYFAGGLSYFESYFQSFNIIRHFPIIEIDG